MDIEKIIQVIRKRGDAASEKIKQGVEKSTTWIEEKTKKSKTTENTVRADGADQTSASKQDSNSEKGLGAMKSFRPSGKTIAITAAVGVLLFCAVGFASPGSPDPSSSSGLVAAQSQNEPRVLSFTVSVDSWDEANDGSLVIKIDGEDEDGNFVSEQYKATSDTKYKTDLKPGVYALSLASAKPTSGTRLFKAEPVQFEFDGNTDRNVVLPVMLDVEAIAAAEAEKKAVEEKKAAEEQATTKKRAAEEKAAQETAAVQNSAKSSGNNSANNTASEMTVYVASSGNGKKYHSNPNCSRMKGTNSMTESQARNRGYSPCSKCM